MSTISNASFAGRLYKFEMLRNTCYPLFTIWRKGWKYATVAFRNSACILFFCSTEKNNTQILYTFSQKKIKTTTTNKQTECPLSCPWCADSCSQTVEDIFVTHWHPKKPKRYLYKRTCHITASILRLCVIHKRANISQLQVALQET